MTSRVAAFLASFAALIIQAAAAESFDGGFVPGVLPTDSHVQQLRDLRSIFSLESPQGRRSFGPEPIRGYFDAVGHQYRSAGFAKIGKALEQTGPIVERAAAARKGELAIRKSQARRAIRRLARALSQNRRIVPKDMGWNSQREARPNYTGLALVFTEKLNRALHAASRGKRITHKLGGVPPRQWITTRNDGLWISGPFTAGGTVWVGASTVTASGFIKDGAGALILDVDLIDSYNGTLSFWGVPGGHLLVAVPIEDATEELGTPADNVSENITIPEGYIAYIVPHGTPLPDSAIILLDAGISALH